MNQTPQYDPDPPSARLLRPVTGVWRLVFIAAGCLLVGVAYLGVLLPGLPATPWLILASYCFARSSPRLQRWLLRSPVFGKLLQDWHEHRGVRRPVKMLAVGVVIPVVTLSILLGGLPPWAQWTIAGLAAVGVGVVLFVVPTVRDGK